MVQSHCRGRLLRGPLRRRRADGGEERGGHTALQLTRPSDLSRSAFLPCARDGSGPLARHRPVALPKEQTVVRRFGLIAGTTGRRIRMVFPDLAGKGRGQAMATARLRSVRRRTMARSMPELR